MWEEGQNWGGHTGKRRQRVREGGESNRYLPGTVLFCFVSRAWSFNKQLWIHRAPQHNATHQHCSLQPWGFWRRASQTSFKPDSVTQKEKEKGGWKRYWLEPVLAVLASGEKGGWKEGDEGHTADTSYWGVPSLGKGGGQLLPCDLCWMRCIWTLPRTTTTTCGWVQQEGESTCQIRPLVCIKGAIWI